MSDDPVTHSPVLYRFTGGDLFIQGVPARDVTLHDWDQLEDAAKADLMSQAKMNGGLYNQVMTVDDARNAEGGEPPKMTKKRGGKRKGQLDPDVNTPGRVDSDVIIPSQPVPPADEPIAQNEPGFVKSEPATADQNVNEG